MNGKIASIALVLIVAIPLLLGYCLNLTEEERTAWQSTETVNVTDYTLNSTSPVYITSYEPANNQQLLATVYWTTQAVTETSIISPGFNSTAEYSSVPIISYGGYTQALADMSSTINQGTVTITDPATNGYVCLDLPTSSGIVEFELDGTLYGDPLAVGLDVEFCTAGDGSEWTTYYYGEKTGNEIVSYGTTYPVVVRTRGYTTLSPVDTDSNAVDSYVVTIPCTASVQLTYGDSTTEYFYVSSGTKITKNATTVTIGDDAYTNVSSIAVATAYGTDSLTCLYSTETGTYANPSDGWTLTASQGVVSTPAYWFNNAVNDSVLMMVDIPTGATSTITPGASYNAAYTVTIESDSDGLVTVSDTDESYNLGIYQYLAVLVDGDTVTVSGIAAWPDMRTSPVLINSVTVTNNAPDAFAGIWLGGDSTVSYRVDSASIYTGTFPITEDYTLSMASLWPDDSYSVTLPNIGVYGDSVTFAGQYYAVTDGTITVNGETVRLLKCAFSSTYDEDTGEWANTINGYTVSTDTEPSSVYFGGEWSFIVMAYKMEETTATELVWNAGEFAFNGFDSDFALLGLVSCVGVFIALGIYGQRSGAKVGTLLLICGCAGLLFLAMI